MNLGALGVWYPTTPLDTGQLQELATRSEQLGYSAAEAESMCARALDGREYASAEEVIQEVFRQQASAPA